LPYEHQGAGDAYRTGDWKDYLPRAAGGTGAAGAQHTAHVQLLDDAPAQPAARLGTITYTRDSDEENGGLHDSDEDPDDDLDI
jgi:hypothetical protein